MTGRKEQSLQCKLQNKYVDVNIVVRCIQKEVGFDYSKLKGHVKSSAELLNQPSIRLISASGIALIPLKLFPLDMKSLWDLNSSVPLAAEA